MPPTSGSVCGLNVCRKVAPSILGLLAYLFLTSTTLLLVQLEKSVAMDFVGVVRSL